jgi:hypothetical protein
MIERDKAVLEVKHNLEHSGYLVYRRRRHAQAKGIPSILEPKAKNETQKAGSNESMSKKQDHRVNVKSSFDMVREGGAFLIYFWLERERNPSKRVGPQRSIARRVSAQQWLVGLLSPLQCKRPIQEICQIVTCLRGWPGKGLPRSSNRRGIL